MEEEKQKPRASSTASDAGELESFICSITSEVMKDPVTLADGHTYERWAIADWFSRGNKTSPLTNEPLETLDYKSNHTLRQAIEEYQKKQEQRQQELVEAKKIAQESKETSATLQSEVVSRFGFLPNTQVKNAHHPFLKAVDAFHKAIRAELLQITSVKWEKQAANTIAGTVLRSLRKKEFNALLANPVNGEGILSILVPFLRKYIKEHPILLEATYPALSKQLETQLYNTSSPDYFAAFVDEDQSGEGNDSPPDSKDESSNEQNEDTSQVQKQKPSDQEQGQQRSCLVM